MQKKYIEILQKKESDSLIIEYNGEIKIINNFGNYNKLSQLVENFQEIQTDYRNGYIRLKIDESGKYYDFIYHILILNGEFEMHYLQSLNQPLSKNAIKSVQRQGYINFEIIAAESRGFLFKNNFITSISYNFDIEEDIKNLNISNFEIFNNQTDNNNILLIIKMIKTRELLQIIESSNRLS